MKRERLKRLIFMALCCDLGIFAKKLIAPAANIITDSLHIPGGIGTGFSLMFIVTAASVWPHFGSATLMGLIQSGIALCLGSVGSMGVLSPLGYILPAFVIDCSFFLSGKLRAGRCESMVFANAAASVTACLTANAVVFGLHGIVLALYLSVSALSGVLCGAIGYCVSEKLEPLFKGGAGNEKDHSVGGNTAFGADADPFHTAP